MVTKGLRGIGRSVCTDRDIDRCEGRARRGTRLGRRDPAVALAGWRCRANLSVRRPRRESADLGTARPDRVNRASRPRLAVVAMTGGIHLLDFDTGELKHIIDPEAGLEHNGFNDGKVDRQGRFVVGSMDRRETYPTGRLFYFQDSYAGEIRVYDYAVDGSIANRRCFTTLRTTTGAADGSTVDAEGFVWNAQIFDGLIVCYAPDGHVDRTVEMPVRKVTSLAFGGADMVSFMLRRWVGSGPIDLSSPI